jgi:hypothetical protein
VLLYSGTVTAMGATNAPSGDVVCAEWQTANWTSSTVSVLRSMNNTTQMASGGVPCSVCRGTGYTAWGLTACPGGDTLVYAGHMGVIGTTSGGGGTGRWAGAGPVCVADNGTANWSVSPIPTAIVSSNPVAAQQLTGDAVCAVCE